MTSPASYPWHLRLYVFGDTPRTKKALQVLDQICKAHLEGNCTIEVFDLQAHPEAAVTDDIIATPTLIKTHPPPIKRIIGELTDKEKLKAGLEIT